MNLASHISDMLKSIGIKAVVIDSTKALHGDSGMITDTDMLMAFSKSGGTKEVVRLVRQLQANENSATKSISIQSWITKNVSTRTTTRKNKENRLNVEIFHD